MKCPSCAEAELVHDTRDMAYTYKGESTIITAITGDFCPACNDAVFDLAESMRVNVAMLALNKQVNASIVDPSFITTVRKSNAVPSKRDWKGHISTSR